MDILFFVVGVVIGCVVVAAFQGAKSDTGYLEASPPKRRQPDLFTLVVGIALGATLFGDDDE